MKDNLTDTPCQSAPAITPERRDFIMDAVKTAAHITRIGVCGLNTPPEAEYLKMLKAQSGNVAALAKALINIADEIADSEGAKVPAPSPNDCLQGSPLGGGVSQ